MDDMQQRLVKMLDGSDLFLRNRARAKPDPLNEYDIVALLDIAQICDKAARMLEKAIVPPRKVGDPVYVPMCKIVIKFAIIAVNTDEFGTIFKAMHGRRLMYMFLEDDIGKTVFLTREEAEQALKECDG